MSDKPNHPMPIGYLSDSEIKGYESLRNKPPLPDTAREAQSSGNAFSTTEMTGAHVGMVKGLIAGFDSQGTPLHEPELPEILAVVSALASRTHRLVSEKELDFALLDAETVKRMQPMASQGRAFAASMVERLRGWLNTSEGE